MARGLFSATPEQSLRALAAFATKAERQRARDYIVHHAGRYGWRPPEDDYQAVVVLARRFWEIVIPERADDFDFKTSAQANNFASRTFVVYAAISEYMLERPCIADGMVFGWLEDPWAMEEALAEARQRLSSYFVLAWMARVQSVEDVVRMVEHFNRD